MISNYQSTICLTKWDELEDEKQALLAPQCMKWLSQPTLNHNHPPQSQLQPPPIHFIYLYWAAPHPHMMCLLQPMTILRAQTTHQTCYLGLRYVFISLLVVDSSHHPAPHPHMIWAGTFYVHLQPNIYLLFICCLLLTQPPPHNMPTFTSHIPLSPYQGLK